MFFTHNSFPDQKLKYTKTDSLVKHKNAQINAMALVKEGAGEILEEKDLTSLSLIKKIDSLINDEKFLTESKKNLKKFEIENSSEKIYEEIIKLTS